MNITACYHTTGKWRPNSKERKLVHACQMIMPMNFNDLKECGSIIQSSFELAFSSSFHLINGIHSRAIQLAIVFIVTSWNVWPWLHPNPWFQIITAIKPSILWIYSVLAWHLKTNRYCILIFIKVYYKMFNICSFLSDAFATFKEFVDIRYC